MEELPPVPSPAPPPPAPALRSSSGFGDKDDHATERKTLRDYYIILRERLWIALPAAILVAVGVGYYQMRETPMYAATASIQWEPVDTVTGAKGITRVGIESEIDLNNKLNVLRSGLLEDRVRKSMTPEEIGILQQPFIDRGEKGNIGMPLGSKQIEPQKSSTTISITVRHEGAQAAALVANKYADEFIKYQQDYAGSKTGSGIQTLEEALKSAQKSTEDANKALLAFKQQHKFTSPSDARDTVTRQLGTYQTDLTQKSLELDTLENSLRQIEALQAASAERTRQELAKLPPNSLDATLRRAELEEESYRDLLRNAYIGSYGTVPSLRREMEANDREYAALTDRYLENHPKMKVAEQARARLQAQIRDAIVEAIAARRAQIALKREEVRSSQETIASLSREASRLEELNVPFSTLQNKYESEAENLKSLSSRLLVAQTTQQAETVPLRVLDRAVPPGGPYTPNIARITRTCIGLGLIVFVGLAVGLSFIDDRIKSAWDVEHFVGVDLLGIIPDLSSLKDEEKYTLVLNDSQAPGTESFLSVYSSVKIHSKLDFPKSILVTSTIPGEGKTLISCNLAGSFARHGKKTLLIDCDLRRPMLHRHFRRENNKGLITWFEAGAPLEGDPTQDPTLGIIQIGPNFSLLCSGGRSRVPTEILESTQFAGLLARLKKMYDLVVIDSPPLGAVTDSLLIAERADEVIYVCRFNRAYKKHIRLHVKALRNGKNEILGVVLNGLSPRRIEYYSNYRYYRSYKKYYGAQT